MEFDIKKDYEYVKTILNKSDEELAKIFNVSRMTLSRWFSGKSIPNRKNLEAFYNVIYSKKIRLNDIKQEIYKSNETKDKVILFHGAKNELIGNPSIEYSEDNKDFGKGFYLGTDIKQSSSFISTYKDSSIYVFEFDLSKAKVIEYDVSEEWMLLIAYFRGKLDSYSNSKIIEKLLKDIDGADVVIAPIADNTMYTVLNDFINGDITDMQCIHALSANRLGKQYIFLNDAAIKKSLKMIDRLYLCEKEKAYYSNVKIEESEVGKNKVKIARREYAGKGKYIEELF